ncbi:MAG: DUF3501 family protein [Pyrinomonadaceae bacterium]|jgi:hypothetical protein|nr:DUF3501 family protein [Pyrinomonadaceae bacterium]
MKKVERSDILDYVTYEEQRAEIRANAMKAKDLRRIHVGENLTFLFENTDTVRYQILEMVRTERIVKEADILHEIKTYNELIGNTGEICCTLLVEIADANERAEKLATWVGLPEKLYLKFADGTKAFAQVDERQNEDEKISSVQFLKFVCGDNKPIAIGCEHSAYSVETELNDEQKVALESDLS